MTLSLGLHTGDREVLQNLSLSVIRISQVHCTVQMAFAQTEKSHLFVVMWVNLNLPVTTTHNISLPYFLHTRTMGVAHGLLLSQIIPQFNKSSSVNWIGVPQVQHNRGSPSTSLVSQGSHDATLQSPRDRPSWQNCAPAGKVAIPSPSTCQVCLSPGILVTGIKQSKPPELH